MQFTDTGHKMEHQHIQARAAEELPGFLQHCKDSHIGSVFPRGSPYCSKPALIPGPLNLKKWGLCLWKSESNDQFYYIHITNTEYWIQQGG